jgi:hypothetical protein
MSPAFLPSRAYDRQRAAESTAAEIVRATALCVCASASDGGVAETAIPSGAPLVGDDGHEPDTEFHRDEDRLRYDTQAAVKRFRGRATLWRR